MRKFLLGLLIIIVVFILLLPYFLGEAVAIEFKEQLQRFNQNPNSIYASVVNYQTYWFSTDTTLLVTQETPAALRFVTPNIKLPAQLI